MGDLVPPPTSSEVFPLFTNPALSPSSSSLPPLLSPSPSLVCTVLVLPPSACLVLSQLPLPLMVTDPSLTMPVVLLKCANALHPSETELTLLTPLVTPLLLLAKVSLLDLLALSDLHSSVPLLPVFKLPLSTSFNLSNSLAS